MPIMSDLAALEPKTKPEPSPGTPWFSAAVLGLVGLVLAGGGALLRSPSPLCDPDTLQNWLHFGRTIAADTLIAAGLLAVAAALCGVAPAAGLWIEGVVLRSRFAWYLAACVLVAIASSAAVSRDWFGGLPHVQDEIAIAFQAQVFAGGALSAAVPAHPEAFDYEYILMDGGRWYSKYFPGPSLVLVPGVWAGLPWIINPLLAGIAVWLTWAIGRELAGEAAGRIAALLMVVSPFRVSLFSMMMAHPLTLVALAGFALALSKLARGVAGRGWALAGGMGLGVAFISRPYTAVVVAAACGLAALVAAPRRFLRPSVACCLAVGPLLGVAAYLGYNHVLTGDALLSPFEKCSAKDRLGFGPDIGLEYWLPSDRGHSLHKAVFRNGFFSLDTLGTHLLGWGRVTLVLMAGALLVHARRRAALAALLAIGSLVIAYLFYYTPSIFAGQVRYWSEAMPAMMLLLAIGLVGLARQASRWCRAWGLPARSGRGAVWLAGLLLTAVGFWWAWLPMSDELSHDTFTLGQRVRAAAEAQGIQQGIAFITTSHYRRHGEDGSLDFYGAGLAHNDPWLSRPLLYARDRGDQANAQLLGDFRGRPAYHVVVEPDGSVHFDPLPAAEAREGAPTVDSLPPRQ